MRYISKKLNIQISNDPPKSASGNATDYSAVLDTLEARFSQEDAYPVHSFPSCHLLPGFFKDSGTSAHPYARTDLDIQSVETDDEYFCQTE